MEGVNAISDDLCFAFSIEWPAKAVGCLATTRIVEGLRPHTSSASWPTQPQRVPVYRWEPNHSGEKNWPPYSIMPSAYYIGAATCPSATLSLHATSV